jgi:hypothetical protein
MSLTIMVVLALPANTSFGDLPVLASLLAANNHLPHLYALRDDRQGFASGIWTLAILSGTLLVAVRGDTLALIPLYAIGVFTGFTVTKRAGRALAADPAIALAVPHEPQRPGLGRHRRGHRGVPADEVPRGAWVVVLAVPAFIALFTMIHGYYDRAGRALGLGEIPGRPERRPAAVVVPVTGVSRLTGYGISQALSISRHVVAVIVIHIRARQEPGGPPSCDGSGRAGTRACHCRCCGPNTPRWLGPSLPSSTGSGDSPTSGSSS